MAREGVSISDVSKHLGVTFEMARRYALGLARPRPKRLEALAALLHTTPAALEYGDEQAVTFLRRDNPLTDRTPTPGALADWLATQDKQTIATFLRLLADRMDKN